MRNYQQCKLGDVVDSCLGKMLDQNKNKGILQPYLANVNVRWGYFDVSDLPLMRFQKEEDERYGLRYGDIVVCEGGEPGRCAIWKDQIPNMKIQKALHRIRVNANVIDFHWLFYWFLLAGRHNALEPYFTGSTIKHLPGDKLKQIAISLPELHIQQKVASILSAYDDAIENNNRRIKILEQMAENLYKEWFVDLRFPGHETAEYENGLPKGWNVCKIGAIVDRLPFNRLYKKDELNSEGKVIVVDQSTDEYIGFHNNEPSHKASMDSPILLFGDHSCKYQLMIQDFSLGENVVPFHTKDCDPYFLFFAINGIVTTTEYKRHWGELTSRKILLPESHLQETFSQKLKPLKAQQEQLILVNRKLRKQRDRLLPRLMSGKCLVTLNANKAITV